MPTVVTAKGQTYTDSFETKSHVLQIDQELHTLQMSLTPYVTMMTSEKMGIETYANSTFYGHEDEFLPDTATITTATAALTLQVVFANDYVYIAPYDIWMNERTKQVVQIVTTTIVGTALTYVTVAGTDAGSAEGDTYRRLLPGFAEGGTAGSVRMTVEALKTFYMQKIRRAIEVTKEGENTATYHGSKRAHEVVKTSAQIKREMEMAAFFMGGTADTTANPSGANYLCPAMHGLYNTITTNIDKNVGALTLSDLRAKMYQMAVYHPEMNWTMFTSMRNLGIIDDLIAGKIKLDNNPNEYGINIKTLRLGGGTLDLVGEPLWNTPELQKVAFLVPNPISDYFKLVNLKGYPLSWHQDVKKDDSNDTLKDEIKGWMGTHTIEEPRFGLLDGITS